MKIQSDTRERVVSMINLRAMCKHASGIYCHTYTVARVTAHRVYVEYSNENEYATPHPFRAVFPLIPPYSTSDDEKNNPRVILTAMIDTIGEPSDLFGEGWQCFHALIDCPILWKNPMTYEWNQDTNPPTRAAREGRITT